MVFGLFGMFSSATHVRSLRRLNILPQLFHAHSYFSSLTGVVGAGEFHPMLLPSSQLELVGEAVMVMVLVVVVDASS